jgi:hypothetical protein
MATCPIQGRGVAMSDEWTRNGGSGWLDAVLYDGLWDSEPVSGADLFEPRSTAPNVEHAELLD